MRVGVVKELKDHERRVAMTPAGVNELTRRGHEVLIETGAGTGSAFPDRDYSSAGGTLVAEADDVWSRSELVVKVKEPVPEEYGLMRAGQLLFSFLHLAADRDCVEALLNAEVTAIAYEAVESADGALPLLAPMSEIAGRLAPQVGAHALTGVGGGRGVLLGGIGGVPPARAVILGAGVSGRSAAAIAVGMGAEVSTLDVDARKLREIDQIYRGRVRTSFANALDVEREVLAADLVIGAVLVRGAAAPKLISNELVGAMRSGSVLVDVSIDQGGCFEDSRPTTHGSPTFVVGQSVFYCVTNMPGSVAHTSTSALANASLPYVLALADAGWRAAMERDASFAAALSTHGGRIVAPAIAVTFPDLPAMRGHVSGMLSAQALPVQDADSYVLPPPPSSSMDYDLGH